MEVKWSPLILTDKGLIIASDEEISGKLIIMGYVDSDWDINLCYPMIMAEKHSTLVEAEVLTHELFHWLIRSYAFAKIWDKLWDKSRKFNPTI
jgi:hypothetical protein